MRRPENGNNVGQANGGDREHDRHRVLTRPVKAGLLDRLKSGPVICAEGYLFELERRGYLQAGAFVPEAVVENPEVVKRLHEDFVHAGSDVVEAFTYYAHRQKLRVIGRENVLSAHRDENMFDGVPVVEACKRLEAAGADVVGLNCQRGPTTLMPIVRRVREAVSCHVAALPVPYRTTEAEPTFQSLTDRGCNCIPGGRPFPTALDPFTCNRYECAEFARECLALDVWYIGLCCGAAPHHIRAVAEAVGRTVPGSRYSPDMSKHPFFGTDVTIPDRYKARSAEI